MKNNIPQELYKASGIYEIRNLVNGKVYVGMSLVLGDRIRNHISLLNRSSHNNRHLQSAYNKYGSNCFEVFILTVVDRREGESEEDFLQRLRVCESDFIVTKQSHKVRYGYNLRLELLIELDKTLNYYNNTINVAGLPLRTQSVSEHLVKEVKILLEHNITCAGIARHLGIPVHSVYAIKHEWNWHRVEVTSKEIAEYVIPDQIKKKRVAVPGVPTTRKILNPYKRSNNSGLTHQSIKEIAQQLREGYQVGEIAKRYLVNRETITEIRKGTRWSNISGIEKEEIKTSTIKLNQEDVLAIKEMLLSNTSFKVVAHKFNVTVGAVTGIAIGRTWASITGVTPDNPIRVSRKKKEHH